MKVSLPSVFPTDFSVAQGLVLIAGNKSEGLPIAYTHGFLCVIRTVLPGLRYMVCAVEDRPCMLSPGINRHIEVTETQVYSSSTYPR